MRVTVDEQLPPKLAIWLNALGHSAQHVYDVKLEAASDSAIWNFALANQAVIITKGEDFPQRKALADGGPAVIWIRLRNTRRAELLARFGAMLPDIVAALERGESVIEAI